MSYQYCDIYTSNTKKAVLFDVRIPTSFYHNAKGLLGTKQLQDTTGMLFKQCNSIHMIGMRIPLDILFLSKDGAIVKCVHDLQPWRIAVCFKATTTLELKSGMINQLALKAGMKLEIKEKNEII